MKLKTKVLFCLLLYIGVLTPLAYAGNAVPSLSGTLQTAQIKLDESTLNFTNSPLILNGEIMVPAKAFFDALGIQVYWIEDTQEILGYRDNIFVKYKNGDTTYYVNGRAYTLKVAPTTRYGEIFIPAESASKAFELNYEMEKVPASLSVDFRENIFQYRQFGFRQFKKVSTTNWGINFYVPEYWDQLDGSFASYGVENEYEYYRLDVQVLPLESTFNREILFKALKNNLSYDYGDQLNFISEKTQTYNSFWGKVQYYTITNSDRVLNGILYTFFENNIGYSFNALYDPTLSSSEGETIFETVMSTFEISKITIDEKAEHYLELTKFFDYDIILSTPLYSNMTIDGHLPFAGTVQKSDTLKGLNVIISKDSNVIEYYVPIINGAFNAELPLAFGFGKHNIKVYVDDIDAITQSTESLTALTLDDYIDEAILSNTTLDIKNLALELSVLNTSPDDIQHLLSTEYVNYDHPLVYAKVNSLTYNLASDYAKARAIYEYIYNNYDYTELTLRNNIASTQDMITGTYGNEVELSNLYTGLLRAINIPARIMRGTVGETTHYWVEMYINGNWIVSDITWEIRFNEDLQKNGMKYFNLSKSIHYSQYDKTELLPF